MGQFHSNGWQKRKIREKSVSNKRLLKKERVTERLLDHANKTIHKPVAIVRHELRPIVLKSVYLLPKWVENEDAERMTAEVYHACVKEHLIRLFLDSKEFQECIRFIRLPEYTHMHEIQYEAMLRVLPLMPGEKEDLLCF